MVAERHTQVRIAYTVYLNQELSNTWVCFRYVPWHRRFLVHYDLDTYNRIIEPESAVRRPRGSGIFFVLKVQGEKLVGLA